MSVEMGQNLNLTGGFLSAYDGNTPVEQNFHLWPEDSTGTITASGGGLLPQQYYYQFTYEWTDAAGNIFRSAPSVPLLVDSSNTTVTPITFTSNFATNVKTITVSSVTGLQVGQYITDNTTSTNIQANTYITAITGSVLTLNLPTAGASAGGAGDTLQTTNIISNTLVIPTLRITAKTGSSLVRIVAYRWSVANQNYYQTTSITSPIINNVNADTVTFVDVNNDNTIIGNPLIYTTGNVVEDIGPPSTQLMATWQNRLFLVDAEDPNLLWYSKTVIEATPVEMSDLLTLYVAPGLAASGSTGPITAIASLDTNLIIFKKNIPYYISGSGPDSTGANSLFTDPQPIASSVGCTRQQSIALTPKGLMFQSDNGIWLLTRGLETSYIGASVEAFTQNANVLSAVSVPGTNQVRFTLDSGITLMYDHYKGEWSTFNGIPSISSCIYGNLHTFLNKYGQLYQETVGSYLDGSNPVLFSFTTAWVKAPQTLIQGWQRAYWCNLVGTYYSPHKLTVGVAYDFNSAIIQQGTVAPDNFNPAYGGDANYGGPTDVNYGGTSALEQWQINFAQQTCQTFQLTVNELYDSTLNSPAGLGVTISGLNLVVGMKKSYPRNIATNHRTG